MEGTFAKLFRTGVRPVEVARRLTREMDQNRTVGVSGATMAPNSFEVSLSPSDFAEFAEVRSALSRELVTAVIDHADDEGYTFLGPVQVSFVESAKRSTGSFSIESRLREGASGSDDAYLTLPDGTERDLDAATLVVGRMPECEIAINDPNISRRHAEIQQFDDGWILIDKGSTNGSMVNGRRVDRHRLSHGDVLGFGDSVLRFQLR